jgi:hypothetical protein
MPTPDAPATTERIEVECLACGTVRHVDKTGGAGGAGECPICRYPGWARPGRTSRESAAASLDEDRLPPLPVLARPS